MVSDFGRNTFQEVILMRRGLLSAVALLLSIINAPFAQAAKPLAIESLLSRETRLMVFAPHPDDESLGREASFSGS